jgi:DNA polymerase-3 subunit alpha
VPTVGSYYPVHAHSEYSALDGMGGIKDMVATVVDLGQPALALTDHGNVAGAISLYQECQSAGIAAFPGSELYVVKSLEHGKHDDGTAWDDRSERYHLGVLALDERGWRGLMRLSSLSHRRDHFWRKPLVPIAELHEWGEEYGQHVAITTGCYFGWVVQHHLGWQRDIDRTVALVGALVRTFPHTFVELQNHCIDHFAPGCQWCDGAGSDGGDPCLMCRISDADIVLDLLEVADRLGLPVVAAQDSHYCDHGDQPAHNLMKSIAYRGGNGEDSAFPGDGFHLADEAWMRTRHGPWWDQVVAGHERLLDLNDLVVPRLDNYRFCVPQVDAAEPLEVLCRRGERASVLDNPQYVERLGHELSVISSMGFDGYFQIVADYSGWCRRQGIFINARGSANGSLVCYLLGITNVDPVRWDVDFDRFLSLDRARPPDIDMDIESDRRDDVIGYIRSRFPSMVQIGTWLGLGISADEDAKGSVFVQYRAAQRSRGEDPTTPIPASDLKLLQRLDCTAVRKGAGAHAGGFVISGDGLEVEDYLATMLIASSNTTVTQAPMDDVEAAGFVKLDLLGLRSLTTVRRTLELIGKDPVTDGMEWIPDDDAQACRMLANGRADDGIFQFEGFSTAKGARKMGVRSTADAIVALALFRPALMHGGQTDRYLKARRAGTHETIHPTVDDLFRATFGVPVWQDDVLRLMRRVALSAADRNAILKAVKMSNDRTAVATKTFNRVHPVFVQSAMDTLGVERDDAERMWTTVMEFTDYGFNRAHGAAYGLLSYRMAWLKVHHPTEFMCALLQAWAGTDKEAKYVAEAKRLKLAIHRPSVNRSQVSWAIDSPGHLRRGFRSIHGIGAAGAAELAAGAPYESIADLCARVSGRGLPGSKKYLATKTRGDISGALAALSDAGALDGLPQGDLS